MKMLVVKSWFLLAHLDLVMKLTRFEGLHTRVRRQKILSASERQSPEILCQAVDLASVFYVKRVRCLQYSAAVTILLRRNGWEAEMVIGAQTLPFESHAWVEMSGKVINDKPYVGEMFQVLDRC
jgi:hypothetical protein